MTAGTRARAPQVAAEPAQDWRDEARCRDHDPEIWFPVGTGPIAEAQANYAKLICLPCPSRSACLDWARTNDITDGVWGGLSEVERRNPNRVTAPPQGGAAISAAKTHCAKGHPYDEDNTHYDARGWRRCRACNAQKMRDWLAANANRPRCVVGHLMSDANTIIRDGRPYCRTCVNERKRAKRLAGRSQ